MKEEKNENGVFILNKCFLYLQFLNNIRYDHIVF